MIEIEAETFIRKAFQAISEVGIAEKGGGDRLLTVNDSATVFAIVQYHRAIVEYR